MYEESVWEINSVMQNQVVISEIVSCEGSSKELNNPIKGLTNIQNEDNGCFRWCLVR